jgi:endoglucanase
LAANTHGYGRALDQKYYWGINGVSVRVALQLAAAHQIDPTRGYLDAVAMQVAHVFGRNVYGRSQVTGVGHDPPIHPHHRPSLADAQAKPWPGLLLGGAWSEESHPAKATAWEDDAHNAQTSEVAINWNTALVYALTAVLQ